MTNFIILSVVCLQLGWTYGDPAKVKGVGAFAYQDSAGNRYGGTYGLDDAQVYSSHGKTNGGSNSDWGNYADAQVYDSNGNGNDDWGNFAPFEQSFQQYDNFFPEYFDNLQNLLNDVTGRRAFTSRAELERFVPIPPIKPLVPIKPFKPFKPLPRVRPRRPLKPLNLPHDRVKRFLPALPPLPPLKSHFPRLKPLFPRLKPLFPRLPPLRPFKSHFKRAFNSNFENQKIAYNAARKAFDLTSNHAGYIPNSPSRFHNYDFNRFNQFMMPLGSPNSAFAGAAAGPGFTHQVAALSPENPSEPNINIMNRFSDSPGSGSNFYSVSSSSYSSSANVDGQEKTHKRAETLVNNNGVVTHYKVEN